MTQREMNRMIQWERDTALRNAARGFVSQINAYAETVKEILDAARESEQALNAELDRWLTPECQHRRNDKCGHGFPAWFCQEAEPKARTLRRIAKQWRKAGGGR